MKKLTLTALTLTAALALTACGSTAASTSPARQNAVMRANWKIYFTLLPSFLQNSCTIIPRRPTFGKLYIV